MVLDEWIDGRLAFEVLAMLKAAVKWKRVAVFLLATAPRESTLFAAWAPGVDCFLTKPFNLAEFGKVMERLRARGKPMGC